MKQWKFLYITDGGLNSTTTLKNCLQDSDEVKHTSTILSSNSTMYIPETNKNECSQKTHRRMFKATLLTKVKNWKHPLSPPRGEWTKL